MKHLNGVYTQKYNWRYKRTGHVLQGRFKAIVVDKDSYLLQLCRYVLLNPVRAKIVEIPDAWKWSSYHAMTGKEKPGEKEFIERCKKALGKYDTLHEVPRSQRFVGRPPLEDLFTDDIKQRKQERNKVLYDACMQHGYTLKEVADFLGIHYTTVSNVIRNHDKDKN